MQLTEQEKEAWNQLDTQTKRKLLGIARRIHVNSGHKAPEVLVHNLRLAKATVTSIAAMKQLKCDACHESRPPDTRPVASFTREMIPWETVAVDVKEVLDDKNNKKYKVSHYGR